LEVHGDLTLSKAFSKANEVLNIATKGIAEVITQHLTVNIDLSDARLVLQKSGTAIMGQAEAEGENRAVEAVKNALDSPLLNDNDIFGSKHVLLKIVTGDSEEDEISMNELKLITDTIQKQAGNNVNIINGVGTDSELGSKLSVTVIATGFEAKEEQKEVLVDIGEDETLDTISSDSKRKEEIPDTMTEDFSQQSMFDFEDNLDISFSETEDTIANTEEDKNNLTAESVEDETTEMKEEEERVILSLDDETVETNEVEEEERVILSLDDETVETNEVEEEVILDLDSEKEEVKEENEKEEVSFNFNMEETEQAPLMRERVNINSQDLPENEITSRKREEKLKNISNILRTPSGLTNLIDEPAFKRNGIDLEETPHSSDSEISNQTLSLGDDNVVQLKQNNSFLHDNVD